MQPQGSADLLALGSHCSVPACQQIDFLPFKCDCCGQVFCLQHRTYESHSCQKAGSRDTNTIVCPICAKAVKLTAADDPYAVFDRHTQTDCDPANYAKVHQRPKCPSKGCREKLGAINTYTCKECGTQVCLKHRFPDAHQCPGKAASLAGAAGARTSQLTQAMRGLWGSKTAASGHRAQQQHHTPAATGPMLRPQSVQNKQQRPQATQSKGEQRPSKLRPAAAETQLAEQCPQCGLGFASVQELIVHVDVAHQQGKRPLARGQADSCPHCGKTFPDAVALVRHVEHSHDNKSPCRVS
ncbi:hypothetical protein ABBQ38_002812 [Trebouxia sp. C0009 RCD-2024]